MPTAERRRDEIPDEYNGKQGNQHWKHQDERPPKSSHPALRLAKTLSQFRLGDRLPEFTAIIVRDVARRCSAHRFKREPRCDHQGWFFAGVTTQMDRLRVSSLSYTQESCHGPLPIREEFKGPILCTFKCNRRTKLKEFVGVRFEHDDR